MKKPKYLPMTHSLAILPKLKNAYSKLQRDFDKAETNEDVWTAIHEYKQALEMAAKAFHKDTSPVNSLDHVRAALGHGKTDVGMDYDSFEAWVHQCRGSKRKPKEAKK